MAPDTPLSHHARQHGFWFDLFILAMLWGSLFVISPDALIFSRYSLSALVKLVALVSTLEALGFFAAHLFGAQRGLLLQGFLGGFLSSTMTYLRLAPLQVSVGLRARALLLSTLAMLSEALLIIATLAPARALVLPLSQMLLLGAMIAFFRQPSAPRADSAVASAELEIDIGEPIVWRRVLKLSMLILAFIGGMRLISQHLPLPFELTTLVISLFESHAVLAALLADPQRDPFVPAIILIVLLGNALSKCAITYWRSRDWKLTRAVGGALFASFLGASVSYLLLLRR